MAARWHAYPDAVAAGAACARHMLARLEEVLAARDYATLALSGGSNPRPLFEALAGGRFPWDKVHLFWVDERVVPPTDPASNYRLAAELFLMPAKVPQRNVHRIHGELMPEVAARRYAEEVRSFFGLGEGEMPRFDLAHCGIGADGHTASLFPGDPLTEDREKIAAAVHSEKVAHWRVTLLPGPLLASREIAVLVTGAEKADIVRRVIEGPCAPSRYPAQLLIMSGRATVFLDQAAATLLEGA